jgi:hypothetical protein
VVDCDRGRDTGEGVDFGLGFVAGVGGAGVVAEEEAEEEEAEEAEAEAEAEEEEEEEDGIGRTGGSGRFSERGTRTKEPSVLPRFTFTRNGTNELDSAPFTRITRKLLKKMIELHSRRQLPAPA